MLKFIPVRNSRVSDNVLEQLKNAILTGAVRPGQKIPSERELTETFQVSRVVIREAVRALELSGFVQIRQGPKGGAYVRELGFERLVDSYLDLFMTGRLSVRELMQVRQHIEPEVARLAAINVTTQTSRLLQDTLAYEAVPTTDHAEWVKRNMATDYVLLEMCNNQLYRAILEPILRLFQELVLVVKPPKTVIHNHLEHKAIVDAVAAGDGPAAANAMRIHLNNIEDSLVNLETAYRKAKGLP